jgi:hypothetical protein
MDGEGAELPSWVEGVFSLVEVLGWPGRCAWLAPGVLVCLLSISGVQHGLFRVLLFGKINLKKKP